MTEVVRPWRGVSAEDRRATRRSLLLEACLDAVGDLGVPDVTVDAICARAGLSKRYFYESFTDRDAALEAALGQVYDTVSSRIGVVLAEPMSSAERRIEATVAALVETLRADARVARLYVEASQSVALEKRRVNAFDEFARLLTRGIVGAADDDLAAFATSLMVVSGTTEVLRRWLAGDLQLSERELIALVAELGATLAARIS